jgi:hypothetical protein
MRWRLIAIAHSGATRSESVPLYAPAVALESALERRTTIRLALLAGPLPQAC